MTTLSRRLCAVAAAASLAIGLAACSGSGKADSAGGAVLRIGTIATAQSLNPFVSADTLTRQIMVAIYPHLVQYDLKTKRVVGSFATKWALSDDDRSLTFTLVPGARWSDGKPLGATDAAWTINLMIKYKDGPSAAWGGLVANMTKATAVDATTLRIDYTHAVADPLDLIAQIPVLPRQYWSSYATGNGKKLLRAANVPTSAPLVGGGPFVFSKYVKGQSMLFRANPRYWGTKPHIAGFGIQLFSNDDAEVSALKAHRIDLAMAEPSLPPTDVAPLKRAGFRIVDQPSASFEYLAINGNPKRTTHRELTNPVVREALEYATNRAEIDKVVMLGFATAGASIIPPATGDWHDPNVKPLPYDIAKANALLDKAGYARGSDGTRTANGTPMSYTLLVSPDNLGGLRQAQILAKGYALIGVKLKITQLDDDALWDAITHDHYRTYDMSMWGWDTMYDPSYMLDAMTCSQLGNNNDNGYCDKAYDAMFARQSVTTDPAARRTIVYAMQEKVANDRPYIVLHYLDVVEAWSRDWSTVTESVSGFLSSVSNTPLVEVRKLG